MNMTRRLIAERIILLLLFISLACSAGRKLQFQRPGQPGLAGIKRLAVAPCTGLKEAPQFGKRLVRQLKEIDYFHLIADEKFDSLLQAHNLSLTQLEHADSSQLKEYGNLLKIDGLLFCDLRALAMDFEAQGTEKVEREVWTGEYERDELGEIIFQENENGEKVKKKKLKVKILDQQFQIRKAQIEVFFRLVDVDVGGLIKSWDKVEYYVDNSTLGQQSEQLPTEDEIKDMLISRLIDSFVSEISPKLHFVSYPLETGFAEIDSGAVYARLGEWDTALNIWEQVEKKYPNNASVYYNIGMAYEATGDYKSAEMHYLKASLFNTEEKLYKKAVKRIKEIWAEKENIVE